MSQLNAIGSPEAAEQWINDAIDRMRHAATHALLSRDDVIIVASVSCIYGLGSPEDFRDLSLSVSRGDKIGLNGHNGCGKSSLFSMIRGELHADAGDVRVPAGWQIAHVAQQTPAGDQPAIEFVLDGDAELADGGVDAVIEQARRSET